MKRIYIFVAAISVLFYGLGIWWTNTDVTALTFFTKEDGFLEWLTFLLFLTTALYLFFDLYVRLSAKIISAKQKRFWGVLVLGLLFIFAAGEEISWGQRLFDIQTGDFFAKHNSQAETNLHNLKIGETKVNKILFGKILFLCVFIHNLVLPYLARKRKNVGEWLEGIGGFYPPYILVAIYVLGALLVSFVSHERHKELLEASGAIHYLTSIFLSYGLGVGYSKPLIENPAAKKVAASAYIVCISFLLFVALILSLGLKI